jgi:hypothetical protein
MNLINLLIKGKFLNSFIIILNIIVYIYLPLYIGCKKTENLFGVELAS